MATETHDATTDAHAAAEAVGMPQLDFSTFPNQIFWLVITLIVIYRLLSRVALPRIAAILAERRGTITNDLAEAENLRARAVEAGDAYNQALADARAEAHKIATEARADMLAMLNSAMEQADAQIAMKAAGSEKAIAEIRAGAFDTIREVATDAAVEIVSAMGGAADGSAVADAVAAQMKG